MTVSYVSRFQSGALAPVQRGRKPGRIDLTSAPSSMEQRAASWSKVRER